MFTVNPAGHRTRSRRVLSLQLSSAPPGVRMEPGIMRRTIFFYCLEVLRV